MKKIILAALITISASSLFTQDLIKLNSGEFIESKVLEVESEKIKYKKNTNITGPTYSVKIIDIEYIKYENGTKELFNKKNKTTPNIHTDVPNKKNKTIATSNPTKTIVLPPIETPEFKGKIKKISGLDVYCLNKPLIKYSVVYNAGDFISNLSAKGILTGGVMRENVNDKMLKLIKATLKKSEKEGKKIDAVVYSGGKSITAIKYEVAEIPSEMYAEINKVNGVLMYAFCDPKDINYEVTKKSKARSGGFATVGTYGLVNSTIEEDLMKLIKRLDGKKNRKIDGMIYHTGKTGVGFKFVKKQF